jgi:hypothetical protein
MSIDKSTMKIFFEAMEGTMIGSGYSSKIVTTPMGPFKWNSATELWENVNNGMVMNNISFQDMILMDYDTNGGGYDMMQIPDVTPTLNGNFGNMNSVSGSAAVRYSSTVGPKINLNEANAITISGINRPISISLSSTSTGLNLASIRYSVNSSTVPVTYTTPFNVVNNDVIRIGAVFPTSGLPASSSGTITVTNATTNTTLNTIAWSWSV